MARIRIPDLSALSQRRRWLWMALGTAVAAMLLRWAHVPAATLLASMGTGVFFAVSGANIKVPQPVFYAAQAVVGAVIAASITPESIRGAAENGWLFLLMVVSVSLVASLLGYLLAKRSILPGTTAIWGTSPGAALTMTIMSESYGADPRLVAFMQYLRVLMVTFSASIVASLWGGTPSTPAAPALGDEPTAYFVNFALTLGLCAAAAAVSLKGKLPLAAMLIPLVAGSAANLLGMVTLTLPGWLTTSSYIIVGWNIGLRFNRPILVHALSALPRIALTMFVMILLCGAMSIAFSHIANIDPMSAFLATSPGGMDSVAIIAASVGGDVSLVMAVQTIRFLVVVLTGPALATYVVKKTGWRQEDIPEKSDK